MNPNSNNHLDEDQLIRAVVDATDLPAAVQTHLAQCDLCRAGKESFAQELVNLGQMAERLAPKPQRRIVLPAPKTKRINLSFLDWRNLVAAAATVAAVLIVVWGTNTVRDISANRAAERTAARREAQQLLTEVNMLVDNALPNFYLEISGEKDPDYDEEFYQFLIPATKEKNLS
jgi:predicted anti-sigma-YlaC factor YlaD